MDVVGASVRLGFHRASPMRPLCGAGREERHGAPPSPSRVSLLEDVEEGAVRVYSAHRDGDGVVGLVTLRRRNALEDARRRTRAMTTHGQDTRLPVREF